MCWYVHDMLKKKEYASGYCEMCTICREMCTICLKRYDPDSLTIIDMKKHTHNMSRWVGDMRSICAASGDIRTQEERQKFS